MSAIVDGLVALAKENALLKKEKLELGDRMDKKDIVPPEEPKKEEAIAPVPAVAPKVEEPKKEEVAAQPAQPLPEPTLKDVVEALKVIGGQMGELLARGNPAAVKPEAAPPVEAPVADTPPELPKAPKTEAVKDDEEEKGEDTKKKEGHVPQGASLVSPKSPLKEAMHSEIRRALGI